MKKFLLSLRVIVLALISGFDSFLRETLGLKSIMAPYALGVNTLTGLIPSLYEALDIVSRELVGFIPSVTRDATAQRAAVGQNVTSFITPAASASDLTPAVTAPDDGDQVIGNLTLTITKARGVPVRWRGEEQRGLNNNGSGYRNILRDQFAQAMRTLTNEIEVDLGAAVALGASRAYGTAGTTPFASTLIDPANVLKILKDNGAPGNDLQMVIDTTAGAKMRTLAQLTKANEAADTTMLRQGVLLDIHGFAIRESAQVGNATAGTGASFLLNGALAIGDLTVTVDTGSGTILAGDVVTIGNHKYVVATALSGGSFTVNKPGIREVVADNAAITVNAISVRNAGFHRSSVVLAQRAPALPEEGDSASDRMMIVDPRSGLGFEVSLYKQYRQIRYEIASAWGVKVVKTENVALLLG